MAATLMAVSGCAGAGGSDTAPTPAADAPASPSPCPGADAPARAGAWPAPLPADVPKPPSSTRAQVAVRNQTLVVVETQTALSLRESIIFVLRRFPGQGFTLGRGDAEPGQADAPFTRNGLFGQVRLNVVDDCHTQWLIAVGTPQAGGAGGTSPLLPQASPSRGATPFPPFGG